MHTNESWYNEKSVQLQFGTKLTGYKSTRYNDSSIVPKLNTTTTRYNGSWLLEQFGTMTTGYRDYWVLRQLRKETTRYNNNLLKWQLGTMRTRDKDNLVQSPLGQQQLECNWVQRQPDTAKSRYNRTRYNTNSVLRYFRITTTDN